MARQQLVEMTKVTAHWWHANRRGAHDPNHSTPYLDLILPPSAVIYLFIGMYAVLGIGLDWHSGTWRGDLLILLLAVGLPLVLAALRHWRRWRAYHPRAAMATSPRFGRPTP
jgi:hypothetical protein